MGRAFTHRRPVHAWNSPLPGGLELRNGQGKAYALPASQWPLDVSRKTVFVTTQKSSGFPPSMGIFSLQLLFHSGRRKVLLSGPLCPPADLRCKALGWQSLSGRASPLPVPSSGPPPSRSSLREPPWLQPVSSLLDYCVDMTTCLDSICKWEGHLGTDAVPISPLAFQLRRPNLEGMGSSPTWTKWIICYPLNRKDYEETSWLNCPRALSQARQQQGCSAKWGLTGSLALLAVGTEPFLPGSARAQGLCLFMGSSFTLLTRL